MPGSSRVWHLSLLCKNCDDNVLAVKTDPFYFGWNVLLTFLWLLWKHHHIIVIILSGEWGFEWCDENFLNFMKVEICFCERSDGAMKFPIFCESLSLLLWSFKWYDEIIFPNFVKVEICIFGNGHYMFVSDEEEGRSSHLLFTLHVYQYRIEKANQAGLPGGELSSFCFCSAQLLVRIAQ